MKKAFIVLLAFCAIAIAQQNKPKIAVYSSGDIGSGELRMLTTNITFALVKSGRYQAIERSDAFLAEVDRELLTQLSGAVDDSQVARLGKRAGAQYVCIVDVATALGSYQVSARMVDVETTIVENMGKATGNIKNVDDITKIADEVLVSMFGTMSAQTPAHGTRLSSTQENHQVSRPAEIEMVLMRGGTFRMGCTSEQGSACLDYEKPARNVTVSDFYIGKYEVTQRQWVQVMGKNPSHFKGDNLPVENVSWTDVQEFLVKLNTMTGIRYRLPTEAEWEYAARGGAQSKGYKYAGSNTLDDVAWHMSNSGGKTWVVGGKEPNESGIYDMTGNVWEWVNDWFGTYGQLNETDPKGSGSGGSRVQRGGSWNAEAQICRISNRLTGTPNIRLRHVGFRLAISP